MPRVKRNNYARKTYKRYTRRSAIVPCYAMNHLTKFDKEIDEYLINGKVYKVRKTDSGVQYSITPERTNIYRGVKERKRGTEHTRLKKRRSNRNITKKQIVGIADKPIYQTSSTALTELIPSKSGIDSEKNGR